MSDFESATTRVSDEFAVIGDVHACEVELAWALGCIDGLGIHHRFCTGDIADGEGSLDATVSMLRSGSVQCVRGNHDRWAADQHLRNLPFAHRNVGEKMRCWLNNLPTQLRIATRSGDFILTHASPGSDEIGLWPNGAKASAQATVLPWSWSEPRAKYLICGHTHRPGVYRLGTTTVLNAGTLRPHRHPCVLVVRSEQRDTLYCEFHWKEAPSRSLRLSISGDVALPGFVFPNQEMSTSTY